MAAAAMRLAMSGVAAAVGALPLAGQQLVMMRYNTAGSFDALQARWAQPPGAAPLFERFERIATGLVSVRGNGGKVAHATDGTTLLVRASAEDVGSLTEALESLHPARIAAMRLRCTWVTFKGTCAAAAGLERGKAKPIDVVAAGELVKQAQQLSGTLQNLPEVVTLPLQPFLLAHACKDKNLPVLRLRGEGMQIADDTAVFGVEVFVGEAPADLSRPVVQPLLTTTSTLAVGRGALILVSRGETTTVLWLHLAGIEKRSPDATKPAAAKR